MAGARSIYISELGALRGIAALIVCLSHTLLVYDHPQTLLILAGIALNPHGAVVLFFVLSGFVLALSWKRLKPGLASAMRFYAHRSFRIFPAMWLATWLAAAIMIASPPPRDMSGFSAWMHGSDPYFELRNLLPAMFARNFGIIPPAWTIFVELIGSLLIPVFVWLLSRNRIATIASLAALTALSFFSAPLPKSLGLGMYAIYFALGVGIALHSPKLRRNQSITAISVGLLVLTVGRALYFRAFTGEWHDWTYGYNDAGAGLVEALGATFLIAGIISGSVGTAPLKAAPLRLLGEWSYSLYLVHFPVMRLIAHTAPAMPPLPAQLYLTLGTAMTSILLSAIIFRFVEVPGIALGKRATAAEWKKLLVAG